jgi:hypothetical protein
MANLQKIEQLKKAIHKLQEVQEMLIAALGEDDRSTLLCEDIDILIEEIEFDIDELKG